MGRAEDQRQDTAMMATLVGALTGQHELSEEDRVTVAEWVIDHADDSEVHDLLVKVVSTQIGDTSEFRKKIGEAIREKFRQPEKE